MPRPASDKRERLAQAAAQIVAVRGIDGATIAAIAERAGVAPGSVYYYLPSKDHIAAAAAQVAVDARALEIAEWSHEQDAQARLGAYLASAAAKASDTAATGNSATLAAHLRASSSEAAQTASLAVRNTIEWAAAQFEELGHPAQAAHARALHLVTGVEGAGQLAHALGDPTPIERETAHLSRWVANSRSSA